MAERREPNEKLRAARRRLPSPSGSGRAMSREELADACNHELAMRYAAQRRAARWSGMTAGYIGALERGETRWPNQDYRLALMAVTGQTEVTLGLYISRPDPAAPAAFTSAPVVFTTPGTESAEANNVLLGNVLRRGLYGRRIVDGAPPLPLAALEAAVKAANAAYQAAEYARLSTLPETVAAAERLTRDTSGSNHERAYRTLGWANLVASKLAAKLGDGLLASVTADRAAACGLHLDDSALVGVAAYQTASALIKMSDRMSDADDIAMTAAEDLATNDEAANPGRLSVRGALLLHAAVTAARLGDRQQAQQRLNAASTLADALGRDANEYCTAFGPTNVLLHRLATAVALGDFRNALELGDRIDTSRMPPTLLSRRAQLHLDLATVHTADQAGDPEAVLHLLEAERIAPQVIATNTEARTLVLTLLGREQRSRTPGLRALAQRSRLAA